MERPLEILDTGLGPLIFDGLKAVCWVVTLRNSVPAAQIRVRNISPGQIYTFIFHQDSKGGHTFAWPAYCRDAQSVAPQPLATSVQNFIGYTGGQLLADIPGTWSN